MKDSTDGSSTNIKVLALLSIIFLNQQRPSLVELLAHSLARLGKKAIEAGIAKADEKASKKAGDSIMKQLQGQKSQASQKTEGQASQRRQQKANADAILNRLMSGSGRPKARRCREVPLRPGRGQLSRPT